MGSINNNDTSIECDVYIQRLSAYIRRNEESLANGLLCFSKNKINPKLKPLRLSFSLHHLYCVSEKIETSNLGVEVGPLNIKIDNPNHEPTFISFMANNARSSKNFESDAKSISSINSMKSIVSSASVYWRNFSFSKDPKIVNKDLRYLYSSFTKIPCLILSPNTKISNINGYEEYPCDTSVPIKMFKNLQVLELVDYEPIEIFGWNILSEQLRILIIRNSKVNDLAEIIFNLVIDDELGRSSFSNHKQSRKSEWLQDYHLTNYTYGHNHSQSYNDYSFNINNSAFKQKRERATTTGGAGSIPKDVLNDLNIEKNYQILPENKWSVIKQLTVSETSITSIPSYVFKPLNNLVKLNLSGNLLDKLPDGLDQLTNIKYLNFSDNYITNLKNLPKNLKNLSSLNFNNNKLIEIDGIENLFNIEKIDLRRNHLSNIKLLKPLIIQFIKNSDKLTNIYLSGNNLHKGYRTDLFNLFNGVKYKNNIKIDDSRPGYFESALLLDAESSFKFLEKFFDLNRRNSLSIPQPPRRMSVTTSKLSNGNAEATESSKIYNAKSKLQSINNKGHTKNSKSTSDINDLIDPFASFNLNQSMKNLKKSKYTTTSTTLTTPKPYTSPTSTIQSNSSPILLSDNISIISSSSVNQKHSFPLANNQNLPNQLHKPFEPSDQSYSSKNFRHSIPIPSPSNATMTPSPSQARSLKHSSTMTTLDIDTTSIHSPAPNVMTPVQVQVEGFQ